MDGKCAEREFRLEELILESGAGVGKTPLDSAGLLLPQGTSAKVFFVTYRFEGKADSSALGKRQQLKICPRGEVVVQTYRFEGIIAELRQGEGSSLNISF
ncbi:MAG: hypothetical protein LBT59_24165 [Clostridiales bacterium]|jgi:hypothetical protein|nr:hypothetical protein [Clostridiales bacterium]